MIGAEEPLAADEPRETRRSRRKLVAAAAFIVVIVLALFLPPLINLGRYRRSVTSSISAALGRPASVGDMELRLLPTPGIAITDLTVSEDPAFGYEPALHANSVVVSLRLSSLWRRRLEVGRISLDDASLNLVKTASGRWSVGSLLQRASQLPNEATAARFPGTHPRFPYIEATNSRINFKDGAEKRPFSLMNAEFSMWQATGGEWQLRLRAQPVRTDLQLHLSDTGELTIDGSVKRANDLHAMPVNLQAEWSGAQLGQVSRLLAGMDSGWRGALDATAAIAGTTGNFTLQSRIRIENLRRQEFQPAAMVNVDARCAGRYQRPQRLLSQLTCFLPEGPGHLLLTGNIQTGAEPATDLQLEVNDVPAEFPLTLLALMRPNVASMKATGTINGNFELMRGNHHTFGGNAAVTGAALSWAGETLALPPLRLAAGAVSQPKATKHRKAAPAPVEPAVVELAPAAVDLGAPAPLVADARITRSGFSLHLAGRAALGRLMAAGANFGLLENALTLAAPKGSVDLDVTTSGTWMPPLAGAGGITTAGTAKVENAELRSAFLHAPADIASAEVTLSPQSIAWQNVDLRYAGMAMRGSIEYPASCLQPTPCAATFSLEPGEVNAAKLETALAGSGPGFLSQMLAELGGSRGAAWPPLQGTVHSPQVSLGRLELHDVSAGLFIQGNAVTINSLDASALGGNFHASGNLTIAGGTPHWTLDVGWKGVKPADAASLFKERWGSGTAAGEATLNLSGYRTVDLVSSAKGTFRFVWQNGGLSAPGVPLPLSNFGRFTADGTIANSSIALTEGAINYGGRTGKVQGDVGFDRRLHLTLDTRSGKTQIGGTVARPTVQH